MLTNFDRRKTILGGSLISKFGKGTCSNYLELKGEGEKVLELLLWLVRDDLRGG